MLIRTLFLLLLAIAGFSANSDLGLGPAPVTSAAPSGAAGGDLGGTYPNPTVTAARFSTPGAIGDGTPSTGAFTTVSATGVISSTLVTGTAPFTVASTTNVANLNASSLNGTTATGAGVIATGGFTLTVPATGTAALLGTANTFTAQPVIALDDATTAAVTNILGLTHTTSGTAANGFGGRLLYNLEDDSGATQNASAFDVQWATAATATRTSKFTLSLINSAAALASVWVINPTSSVQTCTDAVTNTATTIASFQHATSGTAANGFGSLFQFQGADDGGTMRTMGNLTVTWSTAASATRASKWVFNVITNTAVTAAFTLNATSAVFASGFPVTESDTTDATSITTGSGIFSGGVGVAKRLCLDGATGKTLRITNINANASVAVTLGSTGCTGTTAGAPQGWMRIDINGTDRFMPFW